MGKETKIGLAVIGALLSIFGVLLVRHFAATHAPPVGSELAQAPIEPLSSDGMGKPDASILKDSAGIRSKLWEEPVSTTVEVASDADGTPAGSTTDPYAAAGPSQPALETPSTSPTEGNATEPIPPDFGGPADPPGAGPFQGRSSVANEPAATEPGQVSQENATELPVKTAADSGRNPLRQMSAELPLDSAQDAPSPADAESAAPDMGLPVADPFEVPARQEPSQEVPQREPSESVDGTGEPAATNEAFENQGGSDQPNVDAPTEAAGEQQIGPTEAAPQGDLPAAEPQAASDRFEAAPQRAAPDDWQASEPGVAPAATLPGADQSLPVENGLYTVQPGDTLWSISEKVYGTGGYFKALAARNRSILPRSNQLTVGSQVAVPAVAELERDFASLCPKQRKSALVRPDAIPPAAAQRRARSDVYIVAEGDTLFDIARYELGKASRWAEIYELNRDVLGEDFDYLRPGTELVMPAEGRVEQAKRSEGSRY